MRLPPGSSGLHLQSSTEATESDTACGASRYDRDGHQSARAVGRLARGRASRGRSGRPDEGSQLMTPLALENILIGTGAVMRGAIPVQTVFTRIERNSRQIQPGDLFIAVRGERFDGHDFVDDAAAAGATAALV